MDYSRAPASRDFERAVGAAVVGDHHLAGVMIFADRALSFLDTLCERVSFIQAWNDHAQLDIRLACIVGVMTLGELATSLTWGRIAV